MLAQGNLSPLDTIEAKIQSRIAKFLSLKEILMNLMNFPSLTISSKAKVYLDNQFKLEDELPGILNDIKILKAGSWTLSSVANLAVFYNNMEDQIKNVSILNDDAKELKKTDPSIMPSIDILTDYVPFIIFGGLGLFALYYFKKRHR